MIERTVKGLALVVFTFLAISRGSAASLFVYVPGITGEQSPPGYSGAMAIQSLNITPDNFAIVKNLDSASPQIAAAVAQGTLFPNGLALIYNSVAAGPPDANVAFQHIIATSQQIGIGTETDSFAATNPAAMFLELPGITGTSSTPGHPGIMQIDSFLLTSNQFTITKPVDSASPAIMMAVTNGTLFQAGSALFYNSASSSGPSDSSITFGTIVATSHQILNNGGEVPEEQDTFQFAAVVPEPRTAMLFMTGCTFCLLLFSNRQSTIRNRK